MSEIQPSTNGDGRLPNGRFAQGWKGGPGNPQAKQAVRWRQQLSKVVTVKKFRDLLEACYKAAMGGDASARHEILDRCLPKLPDVTQQVTSLQVNVTYHDVQSPVDDQD